MSAIKPINITSDNHQHMINFVPTPTKRPTISEWGLILICISAFLIILGMAGFGFLVLHDFPNPELAISLKRSSAYSLAAGAGVGFIYRMFRHYID